MVGSASASFSVALFFRAVCSICGNPSLIIILICSALLLVFIVSAVLPVFLAASLSEAFATLKA